MTELQGLPQPLHPAPGASRTRPVPLCHFVTFPPHRGGIFPRPRHRPFSEVEKPRSRDGSFLVKGIYTLIGQRANASDGAKNGRCVRSRPRQATACLRPAAFSASVFLSRPILRSFPEIGSVTGEDDGTVLLSERHRGKSKPRKTDFPFVQ